MTTRYAIVESSTGDDLGFIDVDEESADERIIETLVEAGYLDPPADSYEIDEGYPFAEGRTVVDLDGEPVLTLEVDTDDEAAEDDEDDEDEDDDDELDTAEEP